MGVDYTAFACYGVRIKCTEPDSDKIDEAIPRETRVGFSQWGSRPYGGAWGYVLIIDGTYEEIDLRGGTAVGIRPLPKDRDWNQVDAVMRLQDAVHAIKKAGIMCEFEDEPCWMVGGRIW